MDKNPNKSTHYFAGGVLGALIGIAAIYFLEKSSELDEDANIFNKNTLSKVGLGTISFLYSIVGKGKGKGRGKI